MKTPLFEVLISTMNRENLNFLDSIFSNNKGNIISILIINQTVEGKELYSNRENVRIVNSYEEGLSKSRNLALKNAKGNWLLICDDDVVLEPNFDNILIKNIPTENASVGLLFFRVLNSDGTFFRKYPKNKKVSFLEAISLCSIEMVINHDIIRKHKLKFDENFGLGEKYPLGEEAIFVNDLWRKNVGVKHIAVPLVRHFSMTSDQRFNNRERYYFLGAVFFRIFKKFYFLILIRKILSELKNKSLLIKEVFECLKYANKGKKEYEQKYNKNHNSRLCENRNS